MVFSMNVQENFVWSRRPGTEIHNYQSSLLQYLDLGWSNKHPVVFSAGKIRFALNRAVILSLRHFQYQSWRVKNCQDWMIFVLTSHQSTFQEQTVWCQHMQQFHKARPCRSPPLSGPPSRLATPSPPISLKFKPYFILEEGLVYVFSIT